MKFQNEIAILKQFYAALNRGDISALMQLLHPQIERIEFEAGHFNGLEALRAHFSEGRNKWAEGACQPERFAVSDDKILAFVHVRVRLKEKSEWNEGRFPDGFVFRDGKIIQFHSFSGNNKGLDWAGIQIRQTEKADLKFVHEIFNDVLIHTTATFEEEPYTLQTWIDVFEQKQKSKLPFIVVTVKGAVVGYGTYGPFRKASGYKITMEHSLHVDKSYRGQGLGQLILGELIQLATNAGVENLIAAIDADNVSSIKLHEKFGFFLAAKMDKIARKFGRDLSLALMQLQLKKN